MLRVGLTGGIGSGKSAVARRLAALGALVIDSDVLAREVVAPGTDGLTAVVAAFGPGVLGPDGALDRPALASVVFADPSARERLNAVIHPRVRERTDELAAAAGPDAVVVQDIPLLVETRSPAEFDLVVVVHAAEATRVRRLVEARGMPAADVRARIAAQADDDARRAAADVWLDNDGAADDLRAAVDALWHGRLVPFAANRRDHRPVPPPSHGVVAPDPAWAAAGARLTARVARAAGDLACGAAHVGPTAVPGMPAVDVVEISLAVEPCADPAAVRARLDRAGFPHLGEGPPGTGPHAGTDPGRPVRVHVRAAGSAELRAELLWRDWLRDDAVARARAAPPVGAGGAGDRPEAAGRARAERWAASSGWSPSLDQVAGR